MRGIALGVVAGAVLGFVVTPKSRDAKRAAGRFFRTCCDVVDSVSGAIR